MKIENTDWGTLMRAANAGDARAYARLLTSVSPVLRGIINARCASLGHAACEDILQNVLLAIHLKRQTWLPTAPLRPWLFAITRNKIVDAYRSRGKGIDVPIDDFVETLAAEMTDPTQATDMDKMINMLDARSARVVRKIGQEGASFSETGEACAMTEGAVRVALHRALKQLAVLRDRHIT